MAKMKKDVQTFREQFDPSVIVPNKIRAGLADLRKREGEAAWETEAEFLRRSSVSNSIITAYREEFKAHIVEARNKGRQPVRVWFADVKVAKAMRDKIGP